MNYNRFGGVLWALVATLSLFVGNREIKPSNKTKEEIVKRFSLRFITLSRACEPVLLIEVVTDLADSGAQSGSVSNSRLVILPMANCHNLPSHRVRARASRLECSCSLDLQDQFYSCFTRNIHFGTDAPEALWAFFITIVKENLANRGESSRISVNSCPIRAAFGIFLTD